MESKCVCPGPGQCPVYNINMVGRLYDICRGHDDDGKPVLTPEKCEAWRAKWEQDAGIKCVHRGSLRTSLITNGVGKVIGDALSKVGIHQLVKWMRGESCGCAAREEYLNKTFPGKKAGIVPVYHCSLKGECTPHSELADKVKRTRKLTACSTCELRQPTLHELELPPHP